MKQPIRKKTRTSSMPLEPRVRQRRCPQMAGIAAACVAVTVSVCAVAAEVSFPGAGGDLASGWDVDPTSNDTVTVVNPGEYSLSDDAAFKSLRVNAGGSLLSFGEHRLTLTGALIGTAAGSRIVLDGGIFDLSGTAECKMAHDADGMNVVFTNGCIVTNVGAFYAARYASDTKTEISGAARVYADSVRLAGNGGVDNTLEIHDGGRLYVLNRMYSDVNSDAVAYGGQKLIVRGAGSAFTMAGEYLAYIGFKNHSNGIFVSDGALFESPGIILGQGSSDSTNNCLQVENGGIVRLRSFSCGNDGNRVLVSNATFSCSSEFTIPKGGYASSNLFRAYGPDTVLTLPHADLFGGRTNRYNVFSLEGGVKWNCGNRNLMMARANHSTFRISGEGTVIGDSGNQFYFGENTQNSAASVASFNSVSNRMEILDGAVFKAKKLLVMGIANTLCVSNATLDIDASDGVGLRVGYLMPSGYRGSTNCVLVLQGMTPSVRIAGSNACKFNVGSVLRFEIPKDGYADGHVPLVMTSSSFELTDSASRVEIDCEEFVARTGGKLHLIQAQSINKATLDRIRSSCSLPDGCELLVSGGNVYIKSPRRVGFVISFR